jgi:DNA modification methylase
MHTEEVLIKDIKPYKKNAKKHDKTQIDNVAESIRQFGFAQPLVIDKDNVLIIGHCRLLAAKKLKLKEVPCVRMDELTEEQVAKLRLLDNKLNESDWDFELLAEEIEDLDFDGFDLDWRFEEDEEEQEQTEIIEDEVPEEVDTRCKLGDIWQLGNHRLICGDSTDIAVIDRLMDGVKADMVFTDPPYGMNLDTDYSKMEGNGRKGKTYSKVIGDNEDFKDDLIKTIFDNFNYCKEIFLWGVDYYFDLIPNFKDGNLIVWDKTLQTNGDAGYNSEFELLWSKNQHKKEVIHFNWFRYFGLSAQDIKTREHPTQKPLQVITPFIEKYSKENDLIVDIYGGSGSTLIACEQLNRKCYMAELDPHYCDVIIQRWENFIGEKAVRLNG